MKKHMTNYVSLDPEQVFKKLQLAHLYSTGIEDVMGSISRRVGRSLKEYDRSVKEQGPRDENLTPREREVLLSVAKGKTSQRISEEMNLSKHTVDTHRRNIIHKLNISCTMDWYWNARIMRLI